MKSEKVAHVQTNNTPHRNPVRQTPKGAAVKTVMGFDLYRTRAGAVFIRMDQKTYPFGSEGQFFHYFSGELERLRRAGNRSRGARARRAA